MTHEYFRIKIAFMAIEAEFYQGSEPDKQLIDTDTIEPGRFKNFKKTPIKLFLASDNVRWVVKLQSKDRTYAVRYLDAEDTEGEIVDLSSKTIELTVGDELCIVKSVPNRPVREYWFFHTNDPGIGQVPHNPKDGLESFISGLTQIDALT